MGLSQLIYTSTCLDAMTADMAYNVSAQSVKVCQELGLTGRVFADHKQALAMTEGPTEIVRQYYKAVSRDPLVESIMLHTDREITAREFADYSVWLNVKTSYPYTDTVRHLSVESLREAMPDKISARLRIMIEAYLDPDMLAA